LKKLYTAYWFVGTYGKYFIVQFYEYLGVSLLSKLLFKFNLNIINPHITFPKTFYHDPKLSLEMYRTFNKIF